MRPYKDSGIKWIGEIPESWELGQIGQLYDERKEKVSDRDYPPLSVTMKGIVPQLSTAAKTDAHDDRKLVKKGDFAINSRSDRRGSCGISAYDGSVSLINTILCPQTEMNPQYYDWLFHTTMFSDEFYKWGHGIVDDLWTTNWSDMKKISVPVPQLEEQQKISAYLDRQCGLIDSVIEKTKASIEEYKKLRQAVITQAVTKGVRGDRPMKDSGIEWIGEIPEEWGIPQIKHVARIASGSTPDRNKPEYWNGNVKWLKTGELQNNLITDSDEYITELALKETSVTLFPKNTILVAMYGQGKTRGMTALLAEPCTTNQACAGLTVISPKISVLFLWKCLIGAYNGIREMAQGTGQPNLNAQLISNFHIPLPPTVEQEEIVTYIDKKIPEIDTLITKKEQFLTELESYKKSLIYEYVTGKKEVPQA